VVQDVVYAKSILFHYGRLNFSIRFLHILFKVIQGRNANWVSDDWEPDTEELPPGVTRMTINKEICLATLSDLWTSVNHGRQVGRLPLGNLWARLRAYKATDPRDRIFALLSLANEDSYGRCILPDYNSDTKDVFVHAMAAITHNKPGFTFLGFAGLAFPWGPRNCDASGKTEDYPLPSWVPNFAPTCMSKNWSDSFGFYNPSTSIRPVMAKKGAICRLHNSQNEGYDDFQHGVPCPANPQKKLRCPAEHYETLSVYNTMIDTIVGCGIEYPHAPGAWETLGSGLSFLDDGLRMIRELGTYPEEEAEEVLARTLYTSNSEGSAISQKPDRQLGHIFGKFLQRLRAEVAAGGRDEKLGSFPVLDRLGAFNSSIPSTGAGFHRKLFGTKRGYIGLAFNGVRVGDEVRLVHGVGVPFITRPCPVPVDAGGSVVRQLVCGRISTALWTVRLRPLTTLRQACWYLFEMRFGSGELVK